MRLVATAGTVGCGQCVVGTASSAMKSAAQLQVFPYQAIIDSYRIPLFNNRPQQQQQRPSHQFDATLCDMKQKMEEEEEEEEEDAALRFTDLPDDMICILLRWIPASVFRQLNRDFRYLMNQEPQVLSYRRRGYGNLEEWQRQDYEWDHCVSRFVEFAVSFTRDYGRSGRIHTLAVTDGDYFYDEQLQRLVPLIPQLRSLRLTNCPSFTEAGMRRLRTNLTHLTRLSFCQVPAVTPPVLMDMVRHCQQLQELTYYPVLSREQADTTDLLACLSRHCPSLHTLCTLLPPDDTYSSSSNCGVALQRLQRFEGRAVATAAAAATGFPSAVIHSCLLDLRHCTSLSLYQVEFHVDVQQWEPQLFPALRKLKLDHCAVSREFLLDLIQNQSQLRSLNISQRHDVPVLNEQLLCSIAACLPRLQKLCIPTARSIVGVQAIVDQLFCLRKLDLEGCVVSPPVLERIAANLTRLRSLNLSGTCSDSIVTDQQLARMFCRLPKLRSLNLSSCSAPAIETFSALAFYTTRLQHLQIYMVKQLTETDLILLLRQLALLKHLTCFNCPHITSQCMFDLIRQYRGFVTVHTQ